MVSTSYIVYFKMSCSQTRNRNLYLFSNGLLNLSPSVVSILFFVQVSVSHCVLIESKSFDFSNHTNLISQTISPYYCLVPIFSYNLLCPVVITKIPFSLIPSFLSHPHYYLFIVNWSFINIL